MADMTKPDINVPCPSVEENSEDGETVKPLEFSGSMPKDILVYRQDVVRSRKQEGLIGMVMEVSGDSDSEGSITDDNDSESEEQQTGVGEDGDVYGDNNDSTVSGGDNGDPLPDGQVRITWLNGSETTENISDIMVLDRGFLHGDIVSSASNPTGQLGLVTDVDIKVDLLSTSGELIKDVSSKDLKRISEFTVGDFVVHGSWLGRVDEVLDNVTVLFDDGSVCKVVKADPMRLRPVKKPIIDDADCPYYPGQRVRAASSSVFKTSRWLSGLWKANRVEGTVVKVQTASVIVYWIASAYLGVSTNSATVPPEEQTPKNLTLLSCFTHANWQLADWCLLQSPRSLSSIDSASKFSNHREPAGECKSTFECTQGHLSSQEDGSGLPSDTHEAEFEINKESTHLITNTLDLQADSEHAQNDSEGTLATQKIDDTSQLSSSESTSLYKIKLRQNSGAESNDLPENCSCSSASSVSKETSPENWPTYRKKIKKVLFRREKKARKRDENFEKAFLIVNTYTKVNVAWQDGTAGLGLPSTSLIPIHTPNDHEFFPEQYVVEKTSSEGEGSETSRIGVVRNVNSHDRTARARWLKVVSRPEEPREFDFEEVVSAYELDGHPDYDYCYGDVVVRLPPVSGDIKISVGLEDDEEMLSSAGDMEDESSAKDMDRDKEEQQLLENQVSESSSSLPWVGNITGLQDGDILVTWIDGMVSKVGPQEIYVVGRDDDSFDGGSEVSDGGASWETVNDNEMDALDVIEKEDSQNYIDNNAEIVSAVSREDNNVGRGGPLAVPLAALDYVTRLATGLFFRAKKQLDSSGSDQMDSNDQDKPEEYFESHEVLDVSENTWIEEHNYKEPDVVDDHNAENMDDTEEGDYDVAASENSKAVETLEKEASLREDDDLFRFKHFDIAENPIDHHFLCDGASSNGGRKWAKKIQQEWNILEKNLPDDIYVRVFEDRMDLLRAAIVGACGTPYQDGLFFFDFYLSPEYPQVPPSVYYHSGGLRVNPNLYVDGKVCLSLLNTWTGKGNEVWDPSSSSILQVLVSLQGLVLNSKPYFNEAGYEKQIGTVEGEKNSLPYNENTYLLNLKSMMYLLRRPPMHFEDFVKDHFKRRGYYICKACKAYMGDCLIGSLTEHSCSTEKSKDHSCSVGFKLTLAKILPRLIPALEEVGSDCSQFSHLIKSEKLQEG